MPPDLPGERWMSRTSPAYSIARPAMSSRRDLDLARVAAGSEGVVDLDELRACGLDRHAIAWRERNGRLHRIHQGVYAVGHPGISLTGRFIAAAKACGPNTALSHRARAANSGFRTWTERDIEITVGDNIPRSHAGIEVHRSSLIRRDDCMVSEGILMTKPVWTVVALASVLSPQELRSVVRDALGMQLVSLPASSDFSGASDPSVGHDSSG